MAKTQTTQEVLDQLGSNVPPKEQPSIADMMAMMAQLSAQNKALEERLAKSEAGGELVNRPSNPNEVPDEMFPRQHAEPVNRMKERRVWIILEENENIPRNGLSIGTNGFQCLLRPGVRANVPISIVDNLRHAIEGKAVVNPDTLKVERFINVLRFPFRIVRPEAPDPSARPSKTDYEPDDERSAA